MSTFPQITSPPQASAEVLVNRMGETLEHQAVYGLKQSTTTALTWGYYGGRWGGFSITDDTLTLTDASANYVVVAIATGVISVATASTNWANDTDYVRVYKITAASGAVTAVEDHRAGPGGVHGGAGGGGGGSGTVTNTGGDLDANAVVLGAGGDDAKVMAALGSAGQVLTSAGAGTPPTWAAPPPLVLAIACSDESTALTTGTNKVKFINPHASAIIVTAVVASLSTAQASGSIFTVNIKEAGTTILSTKLTIDNTETNSSTAATAAVISDTSIAAYAEIAIDIDQIGDGTAKGLKVYLIGHL